MLKNNIYLIVLSIYILVIGLDVIKLVGLIKKPTLNFDIGKYFYRIHLFILFFGISLTFVIVTFEVNIFNYSRPIAYAQREKISLADFNGFNIPGHTLQGGSEFAFITTSIEYEIKQDDVIIESYFHPARSYVYIDDLEGENLLRHEMYHFHVTEIWAREFRKQVSGINSIPSQSDLTTIYGNMRERRNEMQIAYDYDTDHSYLLGKQLEWQVKIDSLLRGLSAFEDSKIEF